MRLVPTQVGTTLFLVMVGCSCNSSLIIDNPPIRRYIIHNNLDEAVSIYGYDYQASRWLIAIIEPDSSYVDAERGAYETPPPPSVENPTIR